MKKLFTNTNIKSTKARIELFEILQNSHKPLSYDDIKESLSMDKATFYRNIMLFEENGIVDGFEGVDKKRYFEIQQKKHAHFFCSECNAVFCVECLSIPVDELYVVDQVVLNGTCKICLEKK